MTMNRATYMGLQSPIPAIVLDTYVVERASGWFRTASRATFRAAVQAVTGQSFESLPAVPSNDGWFHVVGRHTGPDHGVEVLVTGEGGEIRFSRTQW